jgi:hypothetical protein
MALELMPLATVSESTGDKEVLWPAKAQKEGFMEMGFEPNPEKVAHSPRDGVQWHSMGPTHSDVTTRPHRSLAKHSTPALTPGQ